MADSTLHGDLARLDAVLSAAERLAADIEEQTTRKGFDLATALQCVLAQARQHLQSAVGDKS
ncbi:MAG: hypothetical protein JNK55_00810 [Rubrivivax sp.]|nr:hypothetical protein [Rubrivivax sp.]